VRAGRKTGKKTQLNSTRKSQKQRAGQSCSIDVAMRKKEEGLQQYIYFKY
jgi:hypothetical protein